jgi:hippurate hydrolase
MTLTSDATALLDDLVTLRRAIHADPEVGLDLPNTQQRVLDALDGLPLEITLGKGLSSVAAVLRGGAPGPLVLLRGDMDALPLTERTEEAFASSNGAMHACGHDLHVAGLVGAARLLCARREQLAGDVLFMFQPGEEGEDGAGHMLAEGLLDVAGRRPDAAYGLHVVASQIPAGVFTARPGPFMAAADELHVRVVGAGGHGSQPFLTRDPIPALCEIVLALQTLVTRRFDVFDPVVITVGRIAGGTKENIIPDDARFDATIRTFSTEARDRIKELVPRLINDIAGAHGLTAEIDYHDGYPPTINNADEAAFVAETVADMFGAQRFLTLPHPHPGAEDFSRILEEIPGSYLFFGTCATDDPATAPSNHASTARFDDTWLADGATLLAELAIRRMARG